MNRRAKPTDTEPANLCLHCGLCCNGVIFGDVKLQPEDDAHCLAALGMPLKPIRNGHKFAQPCHMFDGCRCKIYAERPAHCRTFECALLKRVLSEEITMSFALRQVRKARTLVDTIERL